MEVNNAENKFSCIDELRERIRKLEKILAEYGFNQRRGIETCKVSEIKSAVHKARSQEKVKQILKELVETQEILYRELYRIAGAKEIIVDTDTPEKKLKEIKDWLEGRRENQRNTKNLFRKAVYRVLKSVEEGVNPSLVLSELSVIYKRDYDRFRVLDFILSLCEKFNISIDKSRPQDLDKLASTVVFRVSEVGVDKIRKLAKVKLKT